MLDPNQNVSKTMQAFAYSIAEILNYLDKKIATIEKKFQNNYLKENSKSINMILRDSNNKK